MSETQKNVVSGIQRILKEISVPSVALLMFFLHHSVDWKPLSFLALGALLLAVLNSVHHAEIISHRIGEPFGALVLALAITVIEAAIIISLMLAGDSNSSVLARDTVFAAVMIIMTAMTGTTLLIGGIKYREQAFNAQGVISVLTVLVAISVLTLILPNFTAIEGPYYTNAQLIFVAIVSLILYGCFLFVQNFRHRAHFIDAKEEQVPLTKPDKKTTLISIVLLPVSLFAIVMLAESLAPDLDTLIYKLGAPPALSGIIIACIILLPEGISAVKAAAKNQIQQSLNLSLGSALASISLTIPVVAIFSVYTQTPLALGISSELMVLFLLSLFIIILSLSIGKTTILQGIVLLILFLVYLFISINP